MNDQLQHTILIADDDQDLRQLIKISLSDIKCQIIEAFDGQDAVEKYNSNKVDLLILDGMMPRLSGMEVCKLVRESDAGDSVAIILLTALNRLQDKMQGFSSGADDYLTKPFHPQELLARVRAMLRIRDLTLSLKSRNHQLQLMQEKLIQQERQLAVSQLAGSAAHNMGQPISAIILNCNLIEGNSNLDALTRQSLSAIKEDISKINSLIQSMLEVDAQSTQGYDKQNSIIKM